MDSRGGGKVSQKLTPVEKEGGGGQNVPEMCG